MSTAIYPPVASAAELSEKRQAVADRELQWLLDSLKETLESLREGIDECLSLLTPSDASTTLAVSAHLSEAVKGHITRSGISLMKGTISLNMPTLPNSPSTHTIKSTYAIPALMGISSLLSDSALLVNTIIETAPLSAPFLRDQLRLLSEMLGIISCSLAGTESPDPRLAEKLPLTPSTLPPLFIRTAEAEHNLSPTVLPPALFDPPLPPQVCLTLSLGDHTGAPTFVLTTRTMAAADAPALSIRERLGLSQAPKHDETSADVLYGERQVRVREKVKVHVADPGMTSLMAKIGAMERVVGSAQNSLDCVVDAVNAAR